jgi:hypothetical protein
VANAFVAETQPWKIAKDPAQADALDLSLGTMVRYLAAAATLLTPFMPGKMEELWERLGSGRDGLPSLDELATLDVSGWKTSVGDILFPRPEDAAPAASAAFYDGLEAYRNSILRSELAIRASYAAMLPMARTDMLMRQISGIADAYAAYKGLDRLRQKASFDDSTFRQAAELIRQTTFPSQSAIDAAKVFSASDSVRSILKHTLPNIELSASLASTIAHIGSLKHSIQPSLMHEYEQLRVTSLRTAEIQALLSGFASTKSLAASVRPMQSSLERLSSASAEVWKSFDTKPVALEQLSPWLRQAPVVQTYEASRNIVQLVGLEEETAVEIDEPADPPQPEFLTISDRLAQFGPEFRDAFEGAREALTTRNRDYVRHASVSLRELLDKLLDRLAPTETVKQWPHSAKLIKKGHTNKARLTYLFRELSTGPYADFVAKDTDLILQTFYALNKGTHVLDSPFGDEIMRVLVARIEGHLLILLAAADS